MSKKWFEHSYRRNLVDMHLNDTDPIYMSQYDPVKYVDNLVTAGVDTAILYAGSCLGICYWPTRVGHMHNGLHGRDILKEVIVECRKHDLNVNVYFNIWSRWAYDTHPEWRYLDGSGKGMYVESNKQRFGMCCSNTPYFDYVMQQVADLCENYDMDGFWVDMIGWFGGICFCDACKARYERESGHPFPEKIDWHDERWRDFQKHREAWYAEFARNIRETVHQFKPESSVVFQSASWSLGWSIGLSEELYKQSDYLAGDFYGDPIEQSYICKFLESLTENKPIEFMTSRCPTLYEHTTMKQKELLEAQAYASIANNASFVFIDAMNPDGTVNARPYQVMSEILRHTSRYETYLGPQLERMCDVAIYTDIYSLASMKDNGKPIKENSAQGIPSQNLFQIAKTLIYNNITYGVATRKDLGSLDRFQVLVIPNAFMLDQKESEAIRKFVANGGRIYVSRDTSLIHGGNEFLLSDVLGVSWQGATTENETYMAPCATYHGLEPFTSSSPMTVNDTMALVKASDSAEVLATITLPYTPPNDPFIYSSAISNPPGIVTAWPALVRNRYGTGMAVYSAGTFESMPHDAHGAVFALIIRELLGQSAKFETDAPRSVEITLYNDPVSRRLLVCALNFQSVLPNIPVYNTKMRVNLDGRECLSLVSLPDETDVPWAIVDGFVEFEIDRLETFAMYAVRYK